MDFDEIVQLVNQVVVDRKGRPLKNVERIVLQGAWENSTYTKIAETSVGYTEDYLKKDVGPSLWKLLTDVIGNNTIRITKRNIQNVLQDWALQYGSQAAAVAVVPQPSSDQEASALKTEEAQPSASASKLPTLTCWELPPVDVSDFLGRDQELNKLRAWMVTEQCRLVMLWGLAGIGKTFLAAAVAQQVRGDFDICCYIPLIAEVRPETLLGALASGLGADKSAPSWDWVLQRLAEKRCLVILDSGEYLFAADQLAGAYRLECGEIQAFMQRAAEHQHRSCLVWIGQEKPQPLAQLEGGRVRSHHLQGFSPGEARSFLGLRGEFLGDVTEWQQLVERYGGSPQVLKGVAGTILEVYRGELKRFLAEPPWECGDEELSSLARLTAPERELLSWLALAQEPISFQSLQQTMLNPPTMDVVQSLLARGLSQICDGSGSAIVLTVAPSVRTAVLSQMLRTARQEVDSEKYDLLQWLPLVWTSAPERVQALQQQALLHPLTVYLRQQFADETALTDKLRRLHQQVRSQFLDCPGYAVGNLIHLCQQLDIGLGGIDFSQLAVWHANLRQGGIQGANFSQAQFNHTLFAMALGRDPVTAFSHDGQLLAIGDHDGRLLLWDLQAGKLSRVLVEESQLPIRALAFSPDREWLAVGGEDGRLSLWSLNATYAPEELSDHAVAIKSLVFSPDGIWLAAGDEQGGLRIWDLASGTCRHHLEEHRRPIHNLQVSARGDKLVSCCEDQLACLWDPLSGSLMAQYHGASSAGIHTVGFTQLGDQQLACVVGYAEQCLGIWELQTSRPRWILPTEMAMLLAVELSPDGRYLACSHYDGTVTVWDIQGRQQRFTFNGFASPVWTLAFSPDSCLLITTSDYSVRIWDLSRGDCLRRLSSLRYPVSSLTFSHDGSQVVTGHDDGRVRLWQLNLAGTFARRLHSLKGHSRDVRTVAASLDGRWLASSDGMSLRLWSRTTGECLRNLSEAAVVAITFSPDGRWLLGGGEDGCLRAWPLEGEGLAVTFEGHQSAISALAVSPDGTLLASGSRDRTLRLWDLTNGRELGASEAHSGYFSDLSFSPDGTCLLSASSDGCVHWWQQLPSLALAGSWQHPDAQIVYKVLHEAPNQMTAITTSDTRTLEAWSIQENQQTALFKGHTQEIWQVRISADLRRLASASLDEEIRIWDLISGNCEQILRPDRPYEGVNLNGSKGLSEPERLMLKSLGAVMA